MKIILKPIKWLLSIVGFLIVLALILVAFMYKSVTAPLIKDDIVPISETLEKELDHLIDESNTDKVLNMTLSNDYINNLIKEELIKQFGESDSKEYLHEEGIFKLQGGWIEFEEEKINLNVGVHIDTIFKFKTRLLISFKPELVGSNIELTITSIKIGNLPITWVVKKSPSIIKKFTGFDLNELISNTIGSIGTFDIDTLKLSINYIDLLNSNDESNLISDMFAFINTNDLIKLTIDTKAKELSIGLDLNKVYDDKTNSNLVPIIEQIKNENEFELFLKDKAIESILLNNNQITFDALEFNNILNYLLLDGLDKDLFTTKLYKDYEVIITSPYIEITDKVILNIPVKIGKDSNYFYTNIKVEVRLSKNTNNLEIGLNNYSVGSINVDSKLSNSLLELLSSENLETKENTLVVKDFFDKFTVENLGFTNIEVVNNKIVFNYDTEIILNNILDELLNSVEVPNDIKDIINKIKDNENNVIIIEQSINEFIEKVNDLDEATRNKILGLINEIII